MELRWLLLHMTGFSTSSPGVKISLLHSQRNVMEQHHESPQVLSEVEGVPKVNLKSASPLPEGG